MAGIIELGKITLPTGADPPLKHELVTATALTNVGYDVEFLKPSRLKGQRTADILMKGRMWEMKCPTGHAKTTIQKQLKRAQKQSNYIIFDSIRTKLTDDVICYELLRNMRLSKSIKKVLFINKKREVVELKRY